MATLLEVPKLNIRRLKMRLVGDSILVTHRFGEHTMDEIVKKQMGMAVSGKKGKSPKDPVAIFASGLYEMPGTQFVIHDSDPENVWAEGQFGFPAVGLKAAAVRAATSCGLKMTETRQAFHIDGDLVEILCKPGPKMRRDYVRPQLGVTDIAFRPEFTEWSMDMVVKFNADVITSSQVVNLFWRAGFGVGIGSWRPEKDGQWGMFHVDPNVTESN